MSDETVVPTVAEGRAPGGMSLQDAIALADANEASGFPPPPSVAEILEAAKPAEIRDARAAIKRRIQAAEAEARAQAETPTPAPAGAAEPKE